MADEPLLTLEVIGTAISQGSKTREFNPATKQSWIHEANPHKLNDWRSEIGKACKRAMAEAGLRRLHGAIVLGLEFHYNRPGTHFSSRPALHGQLRASAPRHKTSKPDLGKMARAIEDALKAAGLYVDDSRVIRYERLFKTWSDWNGVRILVWAPEDEQEEAAPLRVVNS